jgi:MSHA pilin protein MshC
MEETEMIQSSPRYPKNDPNGFTMFEVIVVVLLIGIVAAFVAVRGSSKTAYDLASEAEILKGHLRYAQFRAMSDTESWGMSLSTNGYQLLKNKAPATDSLPNESGPSHALPSGITITTGAGTAIHFNERGIPVGDGDAPLTAETEIALSHGSATQTIFIKPETGFIP